MLRVAWSELVRRRSRTLALLAGIVVATASFAVLTGTSRSQRLQVRGTVARSFRGEYDVLVRPRGSRSALERRTGEVQPNFLSGLFGGISLSQWKAIERLPGIEAAAPIANIGYVLATATLPVDVPGGPGERTLERARWTWVSDGGRTRVPLPSSYVYLTRHPLTQHAHPDAWHGYGDFSLQEHVGGRVTDVCTDYWFDTDPFIGGPFSYRLRTQLGCFSTATGTGRTDLDVLARSRPHTELQWTFPFLLTAIDPEQEAKLLGASRAVVSGRYFRAGEGVRLGPKLPDESAVRGYDREQFLPVLIADRTFIDEQAQLTVERLADARTMLRRHWAENDTKRLERVLEHLPGGPVVERRTLSSQTAYATLLREFRSPSFRSAVSAFWRVGPSSYRPRGGALAPVPGVPDPSAWRDSADATQLHYPLVPAAAQDTPFRTLDGNIAQETPDGLRGLAPLLSVVGTFDPTALGSANAPLTSFQTPALTTAGGAPLKPNGNPAGLIAQAPTLLTTLKAARVFSGPLYPKTAGRPPISAIRVRVAGVTGIDAVSRERIRQAAERIATRTGLDVDITAGASGAPTRIALPAGRYGRPPLKLTEAWARKGVAATVLRAIDRKSLVLFVLILIVCACFVANAASAAVHARRTELGVLASLGWSTGRLFGVVLAEVGAVGLAAGVLGAALSLPLAALAGVEASLARAALAVVAATVLALLAALVPALRAARSDPAAAVMPAVLEARRAHRPRSVAALALINLGRTPGRTALAAGALAIGVCAITLLLAATLAFDDALVGTLLGKAVAVQVRSTDYIAVAATLALGLASVADVLFLNLRERAAELATLEATGWDDRALGRLVAVEGIGIGALGSLAGAGLGLAGAALFAGAVPVSLVLVTAGAAVAGTLLAGLASLAPAWWITRLPALPLLAGE